MDMEGLSTICAGIGSIEEDEDGNRIGYSREEYCLDNLKDLLRFLRRDDPYTRDVFKQVCKWNIVGKDLIPIIEYCQDDRNLVLNAVKVLVFLTMPVENSSKDVNEQLEYLWNIKSAITFSDIIAVIVSLLEKPLENLECNAFTEDDWKLVQLVLTLFRNILAVQDISTQQKASANQLLSLRDDFLERLFRENIMDLIIVITQHVGGSCRYLRHDNLLLLEIYHYILMGQDPELIAKASLEDSKVGGDAKSSLEGLKSIMQEEAERRKLTRLHAARHSQFSGTFTRLTMDGSKTMCKGMPNSASCDKLLKPEKVHRGRSKRVVKDYTRLPTLKKSILELLHDFLNQFLTGGYNVLMQSIAEDIEKEHHTIQNSDVLMFFQLTQFVTSFQYHKSLMTKSHVEVQRESSVSDDDEDSTWFKGGISGPIAATMNESMFQLVIAKWHIAFEGLKETKDNAFLSVAGSLMKIMIRMLDLVLKLMPENSKEPQTARSILYKLFYDQTDQGLTQFLLNMIRSFDAHKQPKSDLADLVEIIHVVIRLMEKLQTNGTLRVSRKHRKARKKKTDDLSKKENETVGDDVVTQNKIPCSRSEGSSPNMGGSEMESSTQKDCESREDNANISNQVDEIETSMVKSQNMSDSLPQGEHDESNQLDDNFITQATDCDSSADEQHTAKDEVDFKITSLLLPLASSTIISNLCWLLKFYKSNSTSTNHYIICLLKRICDDLDLAPMLYQLSCLVIFYDILNEQKACPQKEYENVVHFLTGLVRRMLRKMKSQPLLFIDVLFWKTRKDCYHINVDSLQHEVGEMKKDVRNWGYDGEAGPSQGKEGTRKSLADALGDDEYDIIMSNGHHFEKNEDLDEAEREKVLQAGSDGDIHLEKHHPEGDSEGVKKRKRRLVLSDKLEENIRGLYEKYKGDQNCSQLIAEALDPDGNITPAQVSRVCKKLGLLLSSKKSIKQAQVSNGTDQYIEIDSNLPGSIPDGPSSPRKPSNTRKRVRALDENQELNIRNLYEQFKEHKRCSYMIAKELDPDGGVTAAQVSRKLKKLGLHTSRLKTEANSNRIAEAHTSTDEEDSDNDNLPLSLLRKSSKNEDALISSKDMGNANDDSNLPGHSSDDELLSAILKKSKRGYSEGEDDHASTSLKQLVAGKLHENQNRDERGETVSTESNADVLSPNRHSSSSEDQAVETSSLGEKSPLLKHEKDSGNDTSHRGGSPENGGTANIRGEHRGLTLSNDADDQQDVHNYEELEDSGDEQVRSASPEKSSAKRRKLRVVMDFDDDE